MVVERQLVKLESDFAARGGGGRGTEQKFWWGCAAGPPETWPCSKLDLAWFWYPVLKWIPVLKPKIELRVVGTCPYVSQENLLQTELNCL